MFTLPQDPSASNNGPATVAFNLKFDVESFAILVGTADDCFVACRCGTQSVNKKLGVLLDQTESRKEKSGLCRPRGWFGLRQYSRILRGSTTAAEPRGSNTCFFYSQLNTSKLTD